MSATSSSLKPNRHVVVVGGGIQGAAVAYYLAHKSATTSKETPCRVTILEAVQPAAAASGKGGGFMGRSWGDGSETQRLHQVAFDLYEDLATQLSIQSYRKLPVLSVAPSSSGTGLQQARQDKTMAEFLPAWLDGNVGRIRVMGKGDDTAQVTPLEMVEKMIGAFPDQVTTVIGKCVGIDYSEYTSTTRTDDAPASSQQVTGVRYQTATSGEVPLHLEADAVVICAGPWSCMAEQWFDNGTNEGSTTTIQLPMQGIKSTSIVWKNPTPDTAVAATALFCGEDNRFGTHLEVYPRPDGTIYLCGIGGSEYISKDELQGGAFLTDCRANDKRVQAAMDSFREMSATYAASGELDRTQACMRPCPPDAMPYIGAIPGYEGAYINAGHNCWGIAWAPACGLAMAELVLDGKSSTLDLTAFDPSRFTQQRSNQWGRKKQGLNVGEQW